MASKLRRHWEEFVPLQQEIRLNQCVTACRSAAYVLFPKIPVLLIFQGGILHMEFSDQTLQALSVASWEAQLPGEPTNNLLILNN